MKTNLLKSLLLLWILFTIGQEKSFATQFPISVTLSGTQEAPSNNSTATGTLVGTYNDVTDSLIFTVTFSGLSENATAAHIHGAPPGISGGVIFPATGFPTGVTSGSFTDTLVLTAGQEDSLKKGLYYFNIHNSQFPGGEIRAQIFLQDAGFALPVLVCPNDTTVSNDAGMCSASVNLSATVSAGTPAPDFYYRIRNTPITSPHVFPAGTTTVIVTSLNAAGYDSCSFVVTVTDTEPPVVTCPANITQGNDPGLCSAVVNFSADATDNCPGVTVNYSPASGSVFPVGTTTLTATATDAAGNTASCTFDVTVNDVEPPVITCPADITQDNDPDECGAVVNFAATATDNCPGVSITYSQDPGAFFPVGTTAVTATATDGSGNISSCTFNITVNDVEPPVIHDLETSRWFLWPPNHKMKNVMVSYTSTDNCPGPIDCEITVTSDEPVNGLGDGDTAPDWEVLNHHLVKLRAERSGTGDGRVYTIAVACTDQYGNTGTDTTTVIVPHNMLAALVRSFIAQYGNMGQGNGPVANPGAIMMNEGNAKQSTLIHVYPNPSRSYFTINIDTENYQENISIRLMDISGRVLEVRNNLIGSQRLRIGDQLRSGIYIVEFRQGNDKKTFKLLKLE